MNFNMIKALNFLNIPVSPLFLLLLFSCLQMKAQLKENNLRQNENFWEQVRFGGSIGLSFGNGNFTGALAPSAIYDFNSYFSAGAGLNAAYASQNNFTATSFGGSLIGMLRPIGQIQISTEYEQLNINRKFELEGGNRKEQYWVPALYLGLGYNTGSVVAGVRYNLLHNDQKSFYTNAFMPFVSVYF